MTQPTLQQQARQLLQPVADQIERALEAEERGEERVPAFFSVAWVKACDAFLRRLADAPADETLRAETEAWLGGDAEHFQPVAASLLRRWLASAPAESRAEDSDRLDWLLNALAHTPYRTVAIGGMRPSRAAIDAARAAEPQQSREDPLANWPSTDACQLGRHDQCAAAGAYISRPFYSRCKCACHRAEPQQK